VDQTTAGKVRITVAALTERQHRLVTSLLDRANAEAREARTSVPFEYTAVWSRGLAVLEAAADADVVILGLEDEGLPGEASHLTAAFPDISIIGVDHLARARVIRGAVGGRFSSDLPTVIRWVARGEASRCKSVRKESLQ